MIQWIMSTIQCYEEIRATPLRVQGGLLFYREIAAKRLNLQHRICDTTNWVQFKYFSFIYVFHIRLTYTCFINDYHKRLPAET